MEHAYNSVYLQLCMSWQSQEISTLFTGMGEPCKVTNSCKLLSSSCFILCLPQLCFCTGAAMCWKFWARKSLVLYIWF